MVIVVVSTPSSALKPPAFASPRGPHAAARASQGRRARRCMRAPRVEEERAINDKADPKVGLAGIGTAGFEPATPATPLQCATGLRYVPFVRGGSLAVGLRRRKGRGDRFSAKAFHEPAPRLGDRPRPALWAARPPGDRPHLVSPRLLRYLGGPRTVDLQVGPGICAVGVRSQATHAGTKETEMSLDDGRPWEGSSGDLPWDTPDEAWEPADTEAWRGRSPPGRMAGEPRRPGILALQEDSRAMSNPRPLPSVVSGAGSPPAPLSFPTPERIPKPIRRNPLPGGEHTPLLTQCKLLLY